MKDNDLVRWYAVRPCSDIEYPSQGIPITSISQAISLLDEVMLSDSFAGSSDQETAWGTVIFRRLDGELCQIGKSRGGWLLILHRTNLSPMRISINSEPTNRHVVFLLPEWTEVDENHLVPSELCKGALIAWLEGKDPSNKIDFSA